MHIRTHESIWVLLYYTATLSSQSIQDKGVNVLYPTKLPLLSGAKYVPFGAESSPQPVWIHALLIVSKEYSLHSQCKIFLLIYD